MGTITSLTLFEQQCMEQKTFKLKTLEEFGHATYKGFTLRNGYRYGITEEDGIHVATSNWKQGNFIYMYFYNELTSQWEGLWIDLEEVEIVEEKGN